MGSCARQPACAALWRSLWYRCLNQLLHDMARMRHNVVIIGAAVSDLIPARFSKHTTHHTKLAAVVVDASRLLREEEEKRQ